MSKTYQDFGIDIPYGKTTGKVKCKCPQCSATRRDKRDKSLSVDLDKGLWNCHYCGWGGSINGGYTDEEKERWMRQQPWYRPTPIRKQKPTYKRPTATGSTALSAKALAWFEGRGISQETLQDAKVTEGQEWMPQKNGKANTVQFNYYLNGQLVNTKFRTGDKCFKLVSGAELLPYNIDSVKGKPTCIITEGEMDALSFIELGRRTGRQEFFSVVSVPNGANANLSYLDDYLEEYFDDKEFIYVAVDTDTKGVELREELLRRFGVERCKVVEYDPSCKDANEQLQKFGADALAACYDSAPEVKIDEVFSVSDFEDSLDAIFEHGLQKGVTIGHPNFDRLCSFETKRICIVTGIPSSGKSEFIDEIIERLNIRYGWRTAYFSPENAPLAYHAAKLIEKFTGKKFSKTTLTFGEYKQVKEHLEQDFFFISPNENFTIDNILAKAKYLVRRKGIKVLVIDPYNRLEDESNGQNETKYIKELLSKLTRFAQRNDVLVIMMAHPTKLHKNKDGVIEPPTLYDISGSAHFYNMADFGIIVHRDYVQNNVEVHVAKVKFKHLGTKGLALFKYNLDNGRYAPLEQGADPLQPIAWDTTNHLQEAERQRQNALAEAAHFDFDAPDPFAPFEGEVPF